MYSNVPGSAPQMSNAGVGGAPQSQLYDNLTNQRQEYRPGSGSGAGSGISGSASSAQQISQNTSLQAPANPRPQSSASNATSTSASGSGSRAAGSGTGESASKPKREDLETAGINSTLGQLQPPGIRPRVTTTMWEDEKTLCYQVDANNVSVVRRADNNMINGTKLLNVAQMTRGRRDGILKLEKLRHVVKIGSMHLKGVWIPFERALAMAQREGIVDMLYPLFVRDIKRMIQTGVTPALHLNNAASNTASSSSAASKAVSLATNGGFMTPSNAGSAATQNGSYYPQQYSSQYPSNGSAGGGSEGQNAAPGSAQSQPAHTQTQGQNQAQGQQNAQTQPGAQQQGTPSHIGQQNLQAPLQMYGYSQPFYNQYYGQYNQGGNSTGTGANYSSYNQESYGSYPYPQGQAGSTQAAQKSPYEAKANGQGSPTLKEKEGDKKAKA